MLMIATAGLAAPYEHFKNQSEDDGSSTDHPGIYSPSDPSRYDEIRGEIMGALDGPVFGKKSLFADLDLSRWSYRKVTELKQIRGCVEFQNPAGTLLKIRSPREAISVFRNALAHNNIYAFNKSGAKEIDEITFFKQIRKKDKPTDKYVILGYAVLTVPHVDFATFLDSWFELLKKVDPMATSLRSVVPETLAEADFSDAA